MQSTALAVAKVEAGSANVGIMLCYMRFLPCSATWGMLSGPLELLISVTEGGLCSAVPLPM